MAAEPLKVPRNPLLKKLVAGHRLVAALVLNTLLLFVAGNLVLWVAYALHDWRQPTNLLLARPEEFLSAAYPGWPVAERTALLEEATHRVMAYEDYLMFREGPVRGKYVNVSEHGFREVQNQGPWPPNPENFNVFVFGGSTMFGSALPDEQTVPSRLQAVLAASTPRRVCVYNFGTSFFYSTQERLRLERLLSQGFTPQVALFVDGLNDFIQADDTPAYRERFKEAFEQAHQKRRLFAAVADQLPAARLALSIRARQKPEVEELAKETDRAARVIAAYRNNKAIIEPLCRAKGVVPVFVWQPIPWYKYDLKYFLWYGTTYKPRMIHALGYSQMRGLFDQGVLGTNFLWCADLQQDEKALLYVDVHHYTAAFSQKLAETIGALCLQRGLFKITPTQTPEPAAIR